MFEHLVSLNPHSSEYGAGARVSGRFQYLKELFSFKKTHSKQSGFFNLFPSFNSEEVEFVDYELLQDGVEENSKAERDLLKDYSQSILPNTGLISVRDSAKECPRLPLEKKCERFYESYHANYSAPKGQWIDSKL